MKTVLGAIRVCGEQGRRRRFGYGRTTFLTENGFGRTTIFDYSAENVLAFSTFLKCDGLTLSNQLPYGVKDGRYKNNHENDTCIKTGIAIIALDVCPMDYRWK